MSLENYIDGAAFLTLTEDDIKGMIPPLGLVKKITKLLPKHSQETVSCISQYDSDASCVYTVTFSANDATSYPPKPNGSPSTPCSEKSGSTISVFSSGASTPSSRRSDIIIPDHWRPEIESCLKEESLTDSARNEIVRTLVNQLFARSSKPTRSQCEELARRLILKYPFVKDDMGNGYVSIYLEICTYDVYGCGTHLRGAIYFASVLCSTCGGEASSASARTHLSMRSLFAILEYLYIAPTLPFLC